MLEHASEYSRKFPATLYAYGFSIWKRPIVRRFFSGSEVVFVNRASQVPPASTLVVWGVKPIPGRLPCETQFIRLEDGFVRSVGLGADLVSPLSWVIDTRGIYFDATQPSDLEVLLQTESFSDSLLSRATLLRDRIVDAGITKYNVGNAAWKRPPGIARVILVPGQVESDASLKFGAPGVNTNLGLLQAVRNANPDSYVLYKPHPDVTAGLRRRSRADKAIGKWCDEVVDVDMGTLLLQVDEVHTMTSLTGFEALLRGKVVKCYGQPFYAGWGLTIDVMQPKRRTRRLLLDELIAGSLILYPRYVSLQSGVLTTPERALDDLVAWRVSAPSENRWWRSVTRLMLRMVAT